MKTTLLSQLFLATAALYGVKCSVAFGETFSMIERAKTTTLWRPVTEIDVKASPQSLKNQIPAEWSWQNRDSILYLRERCADISSRLKALTQINTSATPMETEADKLRAIKSYFDDINIILEGVPMAPTAFDAMAVKSAISEPDGREVVQTFYDALRALFNQRRATDEQRPARKVFYGLVQELLEINVTRVETIPHKTSESVLPTTSTQEADGVSRQAPISRQPAIQSQVANNPHLWWPYAFLALLAFALTLILWRVRRK